MPPSSLHGLNIVDFASPGDGEALPADLAAQLDLWSTLTFSTTDGETLPPFGGLGHKPSTLDDLVRLGEEELEDQLHRAHHKDATPADFAKLFSFPSPPAGSGTVDPFVVAPHATVGEPAPKKARARKQSVSVSELGEPDTPTDTPVTPSEDKRRRNTAASARFRAKKKEREAALERRAKELEGRVGELERECEALRRENGWLKGLVVGVTQAGGADAPAGKRKRE